jgi:hypothetical protein
MAALARAFQGVQLDTQEQTTRTLTKIPQCFTFIVPLRGPQGYSAKLLKENPMGTFSLEIISKGREAVIMLKKMDSGAVYCMSPIKPGGPDCYEKSFDSSRYFVLRLEDPRTGKTGSIGIGFNKREEALEFKVTVQDFLEGVKREQVNAEAVSTHQDTGEFELKGTVKIKLAVPGGKKKKKKKDKKSSGISLSAPPSGGRRRKKKGTASKAEGAPTTSSSNTGSNDLLGMDF